MSIFDQWGGVKPEKQNRDIQNEAQYVSYSGISGSDTLHRLDP